jgi:Fic family protein
MPELLSDMEAFWHNEKIQVPHLIRIAISHYQFETIHPFLDGNGRIGRLLITLYLVSHGLLAKPSLYLSAHLEKQRGAYYDALTRVRESNDMGHWCRFFLQGVSETAENGKRTFQQILTLRQELESRMVTLGRRAENCRKLISHLYEHPALTIHQAMDVLNIQFNPARNLIAALTDMGILKEITGQQRNRVFLFEPYFNIFADGESEI